MKNFKKLIKEAYLGNPLNEMKKPVLVDTWYTVPGNYVYKVAVKFDDGSMEKFRTRNEAEAKYDLSDVEEETSEFDVSESLNEEAVKEKAQYYVKYTTKDGEKAKSGLMSKREAIKKEEALVNSDVKKSAVYKIQTNVDLNGKEYTIDTELDKEIDYRKDEKGRPINEIESGDVVVYNHEDHTVMSIDDDGKIRIRPNEESAILGKRDTFWVKPTDIETKEEFMDRMMKDQIEHDEETLRRERGLEETAGTFGDGVTDETKEKYNKASMDKFGKPFAKLSLDQKQEITSTIIEPKLKDILSKSSSLIGRQGTRNFMDESEARINEVVKGDDFRFIDIKDLHFETDPDRLEDMKIEFGAKMGGVTNREMIEDAEYELRRFRKEIGFGDGSYSGVFLPGSYDAINSKLGDGPYAKKVPTPKWNERKYEQWIEDVASGGGAEFAYEMAQNAKREAGLIDWVEKNRLGFGDVTPLERIQYDIEALAESINEVTQKEIDDIENSGNIDMAYEKAMKLLNSLKDTDGDDIKIDPDTEFKVDLKHLVQKHKIEDVNEGTCGYTPDGKPRSKPAGPYLNEDEIDLNIDSKGKESEDLDDEVNHMFEEDLAENILKKIFGPKLDADVVTILAQEISDIIKDKPDIKDKPEEIAKELAKGSNINPKDLLKSRMGFIGEESDTTNESKEFNFNKMIKEALTPNYLK